MAEGKFAEAREAIAHASKLADLREFPVLSLPLQLLEARVRAAATKPGTAGNEDLTLARRQMQTVIKTSQQIGLYSLSCEARLASGELEMKLNPASGRIQLAALAGEIRALMDSNFSHAKPSRLWRDQPEQSPRINPCLSGQPDAHARSLGSRTLAAQAKTQKKKEAKRNVAISRSSLAGPWRINENALDS